MIENSKKSRLIFTGYKKSGSLYIEFSVERTVSTIRNPDWVSNSITYYVSCAVFRQNRLWWSRWEHGGAQPNRAPRPADKPACACLPDDNTADACPGRSLRPLESK